MSELGTNRPAILRNQPSRSEVARLPQLCLVDHPLLDALVTRTRDLRTQPDDFGEVIEEITRFLVWQALADVPTVALQVPGHSGQTLAGCRLTDRMAALVILRAGLSMAGPLRAILPDIPIFQIGIKRDERSLEPHVYYSNLPALSHPIDHLLLLDPMLATGGSATAALYEIRQSHRGQVSLLAVIGAPVGVQRVVQFDPSVSVFLAALDDHLDDRGYIIPGLGDAGDRVFGTS